MSRPAHKEKYKKLLEENERLQWIEAVVWRVAQEQMREKVAHRFLEMKQARKGLDYRDYPGEDLNGIKLNDAISEIRALPLDPPPSGEVKK